MSHEEPELVNLNNELGKSPNQDDARTRPTTNPAYTSPAYVYKLITI